MRTILASMLLVAVVALPTAAREVVTTQQSVAYDLPEGWTVARWTEKTGEAQLKNAKSGNLITVERYGTSDPPSYAHNEAIGTDRILTWEYADSPLTPGDITLSGNVSFTDAKVGARIVVFVASSDLKGIDKDAAMTALRTIASSVKILGPRKCWPPGECPPGEVKTLK